MRLEGAVWGAVVFSILTCLGIGAVHSLRIRNLADVIPVLLGRNARVANHREFAASTVAASLSLATVVVAFYELVPALGLWLLWPAITTAAGLALFGAIARRVWEKLASYEYRPTLHAYLGNEYSNRRLAFAASLLTTIGYLTAFAVEITVGARFLTPLLGTNPIVTVTTIAVVGFVYTGLGGFRTVVVTDRLQMAFIWLLLVALGAYLGREIFVSGIAKSVDRIPISIRAFAWHDSLIPFVAGIAIMNLLTYIGNMGLWQRIAGSPTVEVVTQGLWSSVLSALFSWSLLAIAAVGTFIIVKPVPGENLLVTALRSMQSTQFGVLVIFCIALGLLGALLSTASTQLIAVSHTIYEDVIGPFRQNDMQSRVEVRKEVVFSRLILSASAIASVGVVELLRMIGFSVADLAFAVYGAALGLVPPNCSDPFGATFSYRAAG